MTNITQIIDGLKIIKKHTELENHDHQYFSAEHDQVWASNYYETIKTMSEDEVKTLDTLGWFEDEEAWSRFT